MNCCVVGLQWGDEGKGKIVDILAEKTDIVVRYSGGANAGHTVVIGDEKFALHLLPSGSIRKETICVISNGVVLDPGTVLEEIAGLAERGISLSKRLFISENAHVVLDYHKTEDKLREASLGNSKIGTTARGIGPCYADKIGRSYAVRMGDFKDMAAMEDKIWKIVDYKNKIFTALYGAKMIRAEDIIAKCRVYAEKLGPYIIDTTEFLHESIAQGKNILFEGAQGSLLDLDHGTFPYVTSSNSSAAGLWAGCGVPAKMVDKFYGVIKAYSTRVGEGPFPSEQDNEIGEYIRERGHEYGTTTGRPRRCGWFDAVAAKYSAVIGGIDEIALLHMDTLGGTDEVKICRAYEIDGKEVTFFPTNAAKLAKVKCIYETVPGWDGNLRDVTDYDSLPTEAKDYIALVEKLIEKPVTIVGVGPGRAQTIFR